MVAKSSQSGSISYVPSDPYFSNVALQITAEGGSIVDSSPGVTGLGVVGGTVSAAQKVYGTSSISFVGSSDQKVQTQAAVKYNLLAANDFCIDFWVQPLTGFTGSGNTAFGTFFYCSATSANTIAVAQCWLQMNAQSGGFGSMQFQYIYKNTGGTNTSVAYTIPGNLVRGTWYHMAITYSASQQTFVIYINGAVQATILANSSAATSINTTTGVGPIYSGGTNGASPATGSVISIGRLPANYALASSAYPFTGFIDNFRVTIGSTRYAGAFTPADVNVYTYVTTPGSGAVFDGNGQPTFGTVQDPYYYANALMLHCEGTNGSSPTTLVDTARGKTLTLVGDPVVSSTQKKFGTTSIFFPSQIATARYVATPSSTDFAFGTSTDFTIDFWMYATAQPGTYPVVMSNANTASGSAPVTRWYIQYNRNASVNSPNALQFYLGGSALLQTAATVTPGAWYYVQVSRTGTTYTLAVNGVGTSAVSATGMDDGTAQQIFIGGAETNAILNWTGYIDELRVSKVGRWALNPTAALPTAATQDLPSL